MERTGVLWDIFTNRFPFAQIALTFVLLCIFLELILKADKKPEPTNR